MQLVGQTLGQPLQTLGQTGAAALGDTPWHDDLLGGSWSWDDDEETRRTSEEIEALLGELIAELEG